MSDSQMQQATVETGNGPLQRYESRATVVNRQDMA